ncbi:hypothetical protein ACEZ9W_004894 [Salmonella enterica]
MRGWRKISEEMVVFGKSFQKWPDSRTGLNLAVYNERKTNLKVIIKVVKGLAVIVFKKMLRPGGLKDISND